MSGDFTPGRAVELAPGIRRVVARNPGPLTGPGTNTYLVGVEEIAVVDPGPADPLHVEAIVAAAGGSIGWVLATHTHRDHSPACLLLRERTGAIVVGRRGPRDGRQDRRFAPDLEPGDGERVLIEGFSLRCVPTPGHASNHVCWLVEESGWLMSGDHILGDVSPVILPPDGDMGDYLDSLARLRGLPLSRVAPGHGPVIDSPVGAIDALVAHRLRREARVLAALDAAQPAALDDLLPGVYADVDASLHELARNTLLAHLIRLERLGRAEQAGPGWRRTAAG